MLITISCSGFYPDFIMVLCWAGHNNSDWLHWKERATLGFLMPYLGFAIFFWLFLVAILISVFPLSIRWVNKCKGTSSSGHWNCCHNCPSPNERYIWVCLFLYPSIVMVILFSYFFAILMEKENAYLGPWIFLCIWHLDQFFLENVSFSIVFKSNTFFKTVGL